MALFGKKKTEKAEAPAAEKKVAKKAVAKAAAKPAKTAVVPATVRTSVGMDAAGAILRPRITEKSGLLSQGGVYTFEISKNTNKNMVADAIKALYKVTPVKVAILNHPAKNVFVRGRRGVVSGVKKALVTLKKGDKIDFV